jgi:small subunit ribosomal protein S6
MNFMAEPKLHVYEAMFLFGSGAAAELEAAQTTARNMIEKHGGQIIVLKKWDERKLAYELKRNKRGVYIIAYFRAPGSAVAGIDRDVRLSEEVLRAMITSADHLTEEEMNAVEPQPIVIVPREDRGYGGGGYGGGGYGGDRGDRGFESRPPREGAGKE